MECMCKEGCGTIFLTEDRDTVAWRDRAIRVEEGLEHRPLLTVSKKCPNLDKQVGDIIADRPDYVVIEGYLSPEAIDGDYDCLRWDVGWRITEWMS